MLSPRPGVDAGCGGGTFGYEMTVEELIEALQKACRLLHQDPAATLLYIDVPEVGAIGHPGGIGSVFVEDPVTREQVRALYLHSGTPEKPSNPLPELPAQ